MPKWQPLHRRAATTATAVSDFSKSSQGPSLGCLASRGGPEIDGLCLIHLDCIAIDYVPVTAT